MPTRSRTGFLESFLYLDVPEPAFDRGKRFIVAVLEGGGHEWRIFIEHVLHTKGNRGVIQPGAPSTGIVFGRGNGNYVFLLAVLHLQVFTSILSKARYLGRRRWRQVERVRCDQVECSPISHFPRALRKRSRIVDNPSVGTYMRTRPPGSGHI